MLGRAFRLRSAPLCPNGYHNSGRVGKKNQKKILDCVASRVGTALCAVFLSVMTAGCDTDLGEPLQSGRVLALQGLEGRWVGAVAPVDPACGPPSRGLMSIGSQGFGFDPFQSTTVINGRISDDGHLTGSFSRQGAQHQDLSIAFDGKVSGSDLIDGTLRSGHCHWSVTLHRG